MTSNFSFFTALIAVVTVIVSVLMMLAYIETPARIDLFFMAEFGFIAAVITGGISVIHMKLEEIEAKQ